MEYLNGMNGRRFLKLLASVSCIMVLVGSIQIQLSFGEEAYPSGKITWIVGAQPGGGADLMVRGIIPFVEKYLKEISPNPNKVGLMVKNVPGSSDLRAMDELFHAKPDGYTIACGTENLHTNTIMGIMDFSLFDITYISRLASSYKVLVTKTSSDIRTWDDIVKASQKAPAKIAITGFGGSNHLAGIFFIDGTKLAAKMIMFDGTAGANAGLIRGDVPLGLNSWDSVQTLVDAKELRHILTFTEKRIYSDVPTIKEIGFPELIEPVKSQRYVIAPPGLPANIKKILEVALEKALADKEFLAWNAKAKISFDPVMGAQAEELVKKIHAYYQSREKLLKEYLTKK